MISTKFTDTHLFGRGVSIGPFVKHYFLKFSVKKCLWLVVVNQYSSMTHSLVACSMCSIWTNVDSFWVRVRLGSEILLPKVLPMKWYTYLRHCMKIDCNRGRHANESQHFDLLASRVRTEDVMMLYPMGNGPLAT